MKIFFKISSLCLLLLVIVSCEDDNEQKNLTKGFIKFNYDETARPGGRVKDGGEPFAILISATQNGVLVFDNVKLSLFSFGTGYVSESLQLTTGTYTLTQFLVLDADNHVIYATPLEGSEQAQFVAQPLPIDFTVTEGGNNLVMLEVLEVSDDQTPGSYGYASFGFQIVTPYEPNTIRFLLDSQVWVSQNISPATYISEYNLLAFAGRKNVSDSTYESFWILIQNFNFTAGTVTEQNTEFQLGVNESVTTGLYIDSNWGTPEVENLLITEYDSIQHTISGTFSGYLHNPQTQEKRLVSEGVFHKIHIDLQ